MDWAKVTTAKNDGVLRVGILIAQNITLITKWWWRVMNEGGNLWRNAIVTIHNLKKKKPLYCKESIPMVFGVTFIRKSIIFISLTLISISYSSSFQDVGRISFFGRLHGTEAPHFRYSSRLYTN